MTEQVTKWPQGTILPRGDRKGAFIDAFCPLSFAPAWNSIGTPLFSLLNCSRKSASPPTTESAPEAKRFGSISGGLETPTRGSRHSHELINGGNKKKSLAFPGGTGWPADWREIFNYQ